MDLLKKNIHMDRIRAEAVTQLTLEDDKNIPDAKPDVQGINLTKADVIFEEVKPGNDVVLLRGKLKFQILYYTTDGGSGLVRYEGEIPLENKMVLKDALPTDSVTVNSLVEDFSVDIINSRKLSIRSLVTVTAAVEELFDEEAPIGLSLEGEEPQWLQYRKVPEQMAQIAICKNDVFRIREEITLPANHPNIERILWSTVQLQDVEFKLFSEKLGIQGDMQVFLLYEGEGDEQYVRPYEVVIPFAGMIDCHDCREGMLPDIRYTCGEPEISVRPDLDGEERCVGLELTMDIRIRIYEEDKTEVLSDLYGVNKEVVVKKTPVKCCLIRSCVAGKMKLTDHVKIQDGGKGILQILHSEAKLCQEQQMIVENGIMIRGGMQLSVLYITGDDTCPYANIDAQIPFQYTLEIPGIHKEDSCKVQGKVEQLQVSMLDGEEMDVKAVLCFTTMVFEQISREFITQVDVKECDPIQMSGLPGMIIYVVKKGDSLWSIGRKYYVTVDQIKKLNDLSGDELQIGQKLLIARGN